MTPNPQLDERNFPPSEMTGLVIKRFGSSGSLPLTSSYDDVRDGLERQLEETLMRDRNHDLDQGKKSMTSSTGDFFVRARSRLIWMWFLLGCALCGVLVGIILRPWQDHSTSGGSGDPSYSHDGNWNRPLSDLDPVRDLGLAEVARGEGASPDWTFLDRAWKSPDDHRKAMPTNAWYQNLIMAKDEPSNLQRVYPIPYLVDVVGVIPGLRTHCTHVDGSSMVLQLSFNEDFGLVLGATEDLGKKTSSHETGDDDDDDGRFRYKVVQTTDLGITLGWVSFQV
jgi:hypothetical protein